MATYESITKAAEKNNTSPGNIASCISGKLKSIKGFIFRYEGDIYTGDLNGKTGLTKKIIQFYPDGRKIRTYPSITDAARKLNIAAGTISRAAKRKSKHAGGFVWRYEGENYRGEYHKFLQKKKFEQLTIDGKKINVFDNISKAAKQTGSSYEGIRLSLNGKRKSSNGLIRGDRFS